MAFAAPPPDCQVTRPAVVAFGGYQGVKYGGGLPLPFDVTRRTIGAIRFGLTTYPLRQPTVGVYSPSRTDVGSGDFVAEGFPNSIVGHGRKPDEAYHDWTRQFHATFQRLYVMRPFEMTEDNRRAWNAIEGLVDVDQYRAAQPLVVRQVGKVSRARPYPQVITWEDGTKERVRLGRMPAEFASYLAGQPFEAVVHRDSVTHRLVRVEFVKRLPADRMTPAESHALWNASPTSADLPDSDWD